MISKHIIYKLFFEFIHFILIEKKIFFNTMHISLLVFTKDKYKGTH